MSKTKTCNKCGRNFIVHSLGEAIPDGCDNCYRTDHPVSKVPLGDCVVHNFYRGTNCVNCGYDQALDHPHPNPKDVETWLTNNGFSWEEYDYGFVKIKDPNGNRLHIDTAILLYTIHHTALTSFRDEVLTEVSESHSKFCDLNNKPFKVGTRIVEGGECDCQVKIFSKAIQTISERHRL